MNRERNPLLSAYALLVYAFLFLPIVVLIAYSFNAAPRGLIWTGFTFDWYPKLLANDELLDALWVTLRIGAVAVVLSTVIGSLLGLGLARLRFRGRAATETLLLVPMVTPEIVMGLSLLLFFRHLFDGKGGFGQLSIAHVTFCVSYVAIVVRARAANMNPALEEAARDLGASAIGAFRHVTLPLIAPAVVAGALLAFSLSFDDYVVTTFNSGVGTSTLPLYIYGKVKFGVTPELNAISTIIVSGVALAILIAWRLGAFKGSDGIAVSIADVEEPRPGRPGDRPGGPPGD